MSTAILSRARTPIGSFLGSLSKLSAPELGATAIKAALDASKIELPAVDEVIMGQVLTGGVGQAPARQASIAAGLSTSVPCTTVNKVCGSGLKAVMMADQSIRLGESKVVVAGGMESMSNSPYLQMGSRQGYKFGDQRLIDSMVADGLTDPYGKKHMGVFGDLCSAEHKFSREEQDAFAAESYERARAAWASGLFQDEMAPVTVQSRRGDVIVDKDEEPANFRPDKMSSLRPAFGKEGTVTAANASKLNDGAAALVCADADWATAQGLDVEAKILSTATFAHDPQWFTTAPTGAIQKVAQKAGVEISDIDLFEINEAFSNVTMFAMKELDIPHEKVNVWGGAVALGHPIGASGARILCTLISAMKARDVKLGCAAICLGGGEAVSVIVQR